MKHVWLHYYSISGFKQRTADSSGFSAEGALTAAFTMPQCQVCQQTHANTQNLTHTRCTLVPGMPTNTRHTKSYTYPLYPSAGYTSKHMPTYKILHIPIVPQCRVCQQTYAHYTHNLTHTHPYRLTLRTPGLGYSTRVTKNCRACFPPSKTHVLIV